MRIFLFTFLFTLIINNLLVGQSTDLDKLYFKYAYLRLPTKPIKDSTLRNYAVVQNVYHEYRTSHENVVLFDDIKIEGFEQKESDAYLTVEINLEAPRVISKELVVRSAKTKNKAGAEVTTNYYTPTWKYRQIGNCVVKDNRNNIISTYSLNADREYKATEMANKASAESTLSSAFEKRIDVGLDCIRNAQNTISASLNKEFGYPLVTGTDYLWILGSSKNPEQQAQLTAHQTVSVNFANMSGSTDMTDIAQKVQSAIDYFETVEKNFNTDDKKHRKLRYAAYYNLATIYHYLDMPDKQAEWANKLIKNDFDAKDGEKLLASAIALKQALTTNESTSRHMFIMTRTLPKVTKEKKPYSLEEDRAFTTGTVIKTNGDSIKAYIRKVHPNQMKGSLTLKVMGPNEKYVDKIVYAREVSTVLYDNGDIYRGLYFAPPGDKSGSFNLEKEAFFVKEIYKGEKLSVYQYLSSDVVIHRAGSKNAESVALPGWVLSPKKKFLEMAKDCPELTKRVESKEFNTQSASLVEFAKALDECK